MSKFYFYLIFALLGSFIYAQNEFQPGYFIKNNVKTECLIKNEGWYKSPSSFTYKLNPSDEAKIANAAEVQAFSIEYTRHKYVSRHFQPVYNIPKAHNFVQVLVEGEASLFKYITATEEQYYFEINDGNFTLLNHEIRMEGSQVREDYRYRAQLYEALDCEDLQKEMFQKLEFKQSQLVGIFNDYNTCKGAEFIDFTRFKEKGKLNLHVLAGTSLFEVSGSSGSNSAKGVNAPSMIPFKVGAEFEYILPIRNKKLALFTGLDYSKNEVEGDYRVSIEVPSTGQRVPVNANYKYEYDILSIPLGIRYFMYLNQNNAFYINPGVSYNMILSENHYEFTRYVTSHAVGVGKLDDGLGLFIGVGYRFKSKFGAEVRYISSSNIYIDDHHPKSTSLVAMITYNLF